ncbi:hypothetical protein [Arthrobacter sp. 9AX]|uniref:hypothetical protein n=1 Tax=Arthrobacter sp. 9AX TaxID=2653131 RepID=UPI001F3F733E|nr:hypothetical protein [Arthrobacter sp. 9AX]
MVFPDRDFVTVEGYQDRIGQTATVEVRRPGGGIVGSAQSVVAAGDVAFEVNHPGGVCWGAGTGLNVTPDIRPGDVVSIRFGPTEVGATTVQDAYVNADSVLDGTTVTVRGYVAAGVNKNQMEQRIVEPALKDTGVGRRDVRAVPGPLTVDAGYRSGLEFDVDGPNTFTATYIFDEPNAARLAAEAVGASALAWEAQDANDNRQGLTIAEFREVGGPGMGGCPPRGEVATVPGSLMPVTPFRALDTRDSTAVGADSSVSFQVAGVNGLPAEVSAVVFNLTVAEAKSHGFVTAYASGTDKPDASNLNFGAGQIVANAVTVPVGADGKVTLFNRSAGTTHLLADVSGYYLQGTPTAAGAFAAVAPTRFLDTRSSKAVSPDSTTTFQVAGANGLPASVSAVVLNLTVAEAQSFGFVSAYPTGMDRPNASTVNFSAGQIIPNSATVPVGADGTVTLFNRSSGNTHLVVDVSGYYLPGTPTAAGTFQAVTPKRFLNTRDTTAAGKDSTVSFQVGGANGIPVNAAAVVFNLTVAQANSFGYITAHATGTSRPAVSNLNFGAGQIVPNSVTVPVGTDGRVSLFNRSTESTHLLADVSGYFLPN